MSTQCTFHAIAIVLAVSTLHRISIVTMYSIVSIVPGNYIVSKHTLCIYDNGALRVLNVLRCVYIFNCVAMHSALECTCDGD